MELNKNNLFSNVKAMVSPFSEVPRNYAKGKVSGAAKVTAFALPLLSVSAVLLGVGVLFLMPHQLRNVKLTPVADFISQHARAFKISGIVAISLGGALATAVLARTAYNFGHLASEPERILMTELKHVGTTKQELAVILSVDEIADDLQKRVGKTVLVVQMSGDGKVVSIDPSDKVYYASGSRTPYIFLPTDGGHSIYTLKDSNS